MRNWTLMWPMKNWVYVANKKLEFGGMRYVQWVHRVSFGFCQALREKNRAKYVVFGLYCNGLYRDPIW